MQLTANRTFFGDYDSIVKSKYKKDKRPFRRNCVHAPSVRQTIADAGASWVEETSQCKNMASLHDTNWRVNKDIFNQVKKSSIRYVHDTEFIVYASLNPLEQFNKVVNDSLHILDWDNGWDDGKAISIDKRIFFTSTDCISKYIENIFYEQGVVINSPTINPLVNGSLDFEWISEKVRFLINFRVQDESIIGYYYGDLYNNRLAIKGTIPTDKVYDHLMKWMQNLK